MKSIFLWVLVCIYCLLPSTSEAGDKKPNATNRSKSSGKLLNERELQVRLMYLKDNLIAFRFRGAKGAGLEKGGIRLNIFKVKEAFRGFPESLELAESGSKLMLGGLIMGLSGAVLLGVGTGMLVADIIQPSNQALSPLFIASLAIQATALGLMIGSVVMFGFSNGKLGKAIEMHNAEVYRRAGLRPLDAKDDVNGKTLPPPAPSKSKMLLMVQ